MLNLDREILNIKKFICKYGSNEQYGYAAANYYKAVIQYYYKCSFAKYNEAKKYRHVLLTSSCDIKRSKLDRKKRIELFFIKFLPHVYLSIRSIIMKIR